MTRIEEAGLKINIAKSEWAAKKVNCLGRSVNTNGRVPDPKKTQGSLQIKEPKNKLQVRKFLGGVNFCRKMWKHRSYTIAPLTDLAVNEPFKWKDVH